jgi:ABC-type antimicrobial peptide transport system permease subunit
LVSAVHVWLDDPTNAPRIRARLHRRLSDRYGVQALTVGEFRTGVLQLMDQIFTLHYLLATIALFVSMVGVTNFLLTRSLERQGEYRLLEAAGVDISDIRSAIVSEGLLLGIVGACLGLLAGIAVSAIIVRHSVPMVNGWHFDFRFPVGTALRVSGLAILLSAGAGLVPAWLSTRRFASLREAGE